MGGCLDAPRFRRLRNGLNACQNRRRPEVRTELACDDVRRKAGHHGSRSHVVTTEAMPWQQSSLQSALLLHSRRPPRRPPRPHSLLAELPSLPASKRPPLQLSQTRRRGHFRTQRHPSQLLLPHHLERDKGGRLARLAQACGSRASVSRLAAGSEERIHPVSRRQQCRRHGRATGCTPASGACLHDGQAGGCTRETAWRGTADGRWQREADAHQPPVPPVRAPFLARARAPFPAKTLRHPQVKHHACAPLAHSRTALHRAKALRLAKKEAGLQEARPTLLTCLLLLLRLLLLLLLLLALECVGASATQLSVRLGGGAPSCAPLALAAPARQKRPHNVKRDLIVHVRVCMGEHTCKHLELRALVRSKALHQA